MILDNRHAGGAGEPVARTATAFPCDLDRMFTAFSLDEAAGNQDRPTSCRRVIAERGGEIAVSSQRGQGTRTTIRLPVTLRLPATLEGGSYGAPHGRCR